MSIPTGLPEAMVATAHPDGQFSPARQPFSRARYRLHGTRSYRAVMSVKQSDWKNSVPRAAHRSEADSKNWSKAAHSGKVGDFREHQIVWWAVIGCLRTSGRQYTSCGSTSCDTVTTRRNRRVEPSSHKFNHSCCLTRNLPRIQLTTIEA